MDFDELWNALLHSQYSKILQKGAFQDNPVKQRFLRRKKADKGHLPARLSFGSKEEYIATLSVEARITQEYEEREQRQSFRCSAIVEQMIFKGKNINVASLTNVPSKNHEAIRPGNKAMVRYKQPVAEHSRRGQWELRIIESPPSSEPRTLLGLLESPRTTDGQHYIASARFPESEQVEFSVDMAPRHSQYVSIFQAQQILAAASSSSVKNSRTRPKKRTQMGHLQTPSQQGLVEG
ncbi:hypothetical protein AB5N19_06909 [Seiridium cardinale]|uniref:Uncharacterized protein n=1 Tax=Seiridium cardinale TaxID=138064 RepID=A0ABR2XKD3_9PEZI